VNGTTAQRRESGRSDSSNAQRTKTVMKKILLLFAVILVGVGTATAQGAAGVIIKQRAKELSNQNNVRQGVPTPAPSAKPATSQTASSAATTAATLKQQNIAKLKSDLAAIVGKGAASTDLKQRFSRDLLAGAQGGSKPSGAAVAKFADSLSASLATKSVESADQARLAQDLNAVVDCENLGETRVKAVLDDVQAILQVSGAKRSEAVSVVADLRAIASEVLHAPVR
jgi:hypothetical protein